MEAVMPCNTVKLQNGFTAIVCSRGRRSRPEPCVGCGAPGVRLCDMKGRRNGRATTCSRSVCNRCTFSPAPEKDLCPEHAALWNGRPTKEAK